MFEGFEQSGYVATEYMIRLEQEDLDDRRKLGAIAAAAGMEPGAFAERYGYIVAVRAKAGAKP